MKNNSFARLARAFFTLYVSQRSRPIIRELKQPRRRRQQERYKSAYLTMKNSSFARFARAVFIFGHLAGVLVPSTT